jgi:hypothetical protein
MKYTNRLHSDYLSQADGPVLASDGLLELIDRSAGSVEIQVGELILSGPAISFGSLLSTGILSVSIKCDRALGPRDIIGMKGPCKVSFSDTEVKGFVVSVTSKIEDGTLDFSFMPDGDM